MTDWLERLDYGNGSTSGGIDRFWLSGGLRISPMEQVGFLRRLYEGNLPITELTRLVLRELIIQNMGPDQVLRAKTGWAINATPDEVGWYVGWLEQGENAYYFATLVIGSNWRNPSLGRGSHPQTEEEALLPPAQLGRQAHGPDVPFETVELDRLQSTIGADADLFDLAIFVHLHRHRRVDRLGPPRYATGPGRGLGTYPRQ